MNRAHDRAERTATNLLVRVDLVRRAKAFELNLSQVFESALERAIKEVERQAWLDANGDAIDAYNAAVARRGVFSDGWRRF